MSSKGTEPVTLLLKKAGDGNPQATAALLPLVYEELRVIARQKMAQERCGHTFSATVLVHEAYLRLVGPGEVRWSNRAQFFFAAAEAMRRVLVEKARGRNRQKRDGERHRLPLDAVDLAFQPDFLEILAVDEAICRMDKEAPSVAAVVRLRFFAGLSVQETARALDVSERNVYRDWAYARAWLAKTLGEARS